MGLMRSNGVRLLALAVASSLAGCATTPRYEVDSDQVAKAERNARAFGYQVIWVNYPTKAGSENK